MTTATTIYPYSAVVFITDVIGGQQFQASGVLIADNEVLTAAHVVYSTGVGTATGIQVSPGYDSGFTPYGTIAGTLTHYNAINDAGNVISFQQSQFDFAVIKLAHPIPNAPAMGLLADFGGGIANVTGYPASQGGGQAQSVQNVALDPNYNLLDGTALGPGSSGGPVWVQQDGRPAVVGLVSTGTVAGGSGYNVRLTQAGIDTINGWVSADNPLSVADEDVFISRFYLTVLGRSADPGAYGYWETALSNGLSPGQLRVDLATSSEALGDLRAAYQNELGRPADAGGLTAFGNALRADLALSDIRAALAQSAEGQAALASLYQSVLGRAPDAAGLGYFTGTLAGGGSLAAVRATLANSSEASGDVAGLYQNDLGRQADPGGLAYFTSTLANGGSLSGVANFLASSDEGQSAIGNLYQNVLGRAPYSAELTAATQSLANGGSLAAWRAGLANSHEAESDIRLAVFQNAGTQPSASDLAAGIQLLASGTSLAQFGSHEAAVAPSRYTDDGAGTTVAASYSNIVYQIAFVANPATANVTPVLQTDAGTTPSGTAVNAATYPVSQGGGQAQPAQQVDQSAVVTQLYAAVLGRGVDADGLANWTAALNNGLSSAQLRVYLANSAEAQADLQAAYQGELGRAADAGGLLSFTGVLGTTTTLADVHTLLAQSPEGQVALSARYQTVLGRAPDSPGLAFFTQFLAANSSLATVTMALAGSQEATDHINTAYQNELNRAADPEGLAYFRQSLVNGGSLSAISQTLAGSPEATTRVAALLQQDFGTTPTIAAINAAQLQLTLGLTFAQLATQETILAANPTLVVANGNGVSLFGGLTVIDETNAGYIISGFKQSQDIVEFTTAQFANFQSILSNTLPAASIGGGFEIFSHQNGQTIVGLTIQSGLGNPGFILTAANFRFV